MVSEFEIKDLALVMALCPAAVVIEVEVWFKRGRLSTYSQRASSSYTPWPQHSLSSLKAHFHKIRRGAPAELDRAIESLW